MRTRTLVVEPDGLDAAVATAQKEARARADGLHVFVTRGLSNALVVVLTFPDTPVPQPKKGKK